MLRFLIFSLLLLSCSSLKKLQKQTTFFEKKEIKTSRKKDSLRSVFAQKKKVIIEDTGRIVTYELTQPATLKDIQSGAALIHKVIIENKKITQKTTQKIAAQTTAVTEKKDSATTLLKEDKEVLMITKKTPQTRTLWLWIIAAAILFAAGSFIFKRYFKWF